MNCPSCGTACPDNSRFCPNCGFSLPKKEDNKLVVEVVPRNVRWETCEILFSTSTDRLFAKAFGESGEFVAGETYELYDFRKGYGERFPDRSPGNEKACSLLLAQLAREGWDRVGEGSFSAWFAGSFKRRAQRESSGTWEYCEILYLLMEGKGRFGTDLPSFVAIAHGPKGTYVAAVQAQKIEASPEDPDRKAFLMSPGYHDRLLAKCQPLQRSVVQALLNDGWEMIDNLPSYPWWRKCFRRPVQTE